MAVLPDGDRQAVTDEWMREESVERNPCSILKSDVRAAFNAADQWAEDNRVSYNSALPVAARTNLTAAQKARVLTYAVRKRWIRGA